MTLVKLNHSPLPKTFGGIMEDIFNNAGLNKLWKDDFATADFFGAHPPVNVHETKEAYLLDVMAPGFLKEDFKISVEDKTLTISAEKKTETKDENEKQIRKEFSFRSFKRAFTLHESVDASKINAKYDNGVLKVNLPKKESKQDAPKAITVE